MFKALRPVIAGAWLLDESRIVSTKPLKPGLIHICFQVQHTHLPAILDWASKTRFGDFCSLKIRLLMKSTAATFHVQDNYWIKSVTKASNDDGCQSQHLFLDCDQSRIIFCLLTPVGPSCSKSAQTIFKILLFVCFLWFPQKWVPDLENQTLAYEQI